MSGEGFRGTFVGATGELRIPALRSRDYIEAERGWRVGTDGSAEFENVAFRGDVGGVLIGADRFVVGSEGLWLPTGDEVGELLEQTRWAARDDGPIPNGPVMPKGVMGYTFGQSLGGAVYDGTERGLIAVRYAEDVRRTYLVLAQLRIDQAAADGWFVRFRTTTNNTLPKVTDAVMRDAVIPSTGVNGTLNFAFTHLSGVVASRTTWIAMMLRRFRGTGTATIIADTGFLNPLSLTVIDMGPQLDSPASLVTGESSAVYARPGTVEVEPTPEPEPLKTVSKTFQATWSRTYDGDRSTTFDDTPYMYQGYYSSGRGNTRSLMGFDYNAIQAFLVGASNIRVKLTFKVAHTYAGSGSDIRVSAHSYTSKPATWNGDVVNEFEGGRTSADEGSTYTVSLSSAVASGFKSGGVKGLGFGPGPNNDKLYYAYMYGASHGANPYVTVTCDK